MKERVTKYDVAKAANVSHMTVTRVLNESAGVSDATRQKVLAACAAMGYTRDLVAKSLKESRTYTLGIMVSSLSQSYFSRIISAVEDRVSGESYHVLVAQSSSGEALPMFLGRRVDGIVMVEQTCSDDIYSMIQGSHVPAVFVGFPPTQGEHAFIGVDDRLGACEAVRHLLSLGHRSIAHLSMGEYYTAKMRMKGFADALSEAGIVGDTYTGSSDMQGGYEACEQLLASGKRYTAVFCDNDYMAMGLLSYLDEHSVRVPDDVSVVGFAGDEIGRYSVPALTTVSQNAEMLGKLAAEYLLSEIEGNGTRSEMLLTPELIVRKSTAKISTIA